jgi:hypothetical protein
MLSVISQANCLDRFGAGRTAVVVPTGQSRTFGALKAADMSVDESADGRRVHR